MSVFALMAKHVHAPFLNLAWLGLLSVLSSVLVWSLLCWSHTQKSVKISAAIESMIVVFDCSALQNLQSVRRYKHAVKHDCFSSKPPAKTSLHLQELNVKLAKITKQLEALQAAMDVPGKKPVDGPSASANSQNGQQASDDSKDDDTQAERQETFGKTD